MPRLRPLHPLSIPPRTKVLAPYFALCTFDEPESKGAIIKKGDDMSFAAVDTLAHLRRFLRDPDQDGDPVVLPGGELSTEE